MLTERLTSYCSHVTPVYAITAIFDHFIIYFNGQGKIQLSPGEVSVSLDIKFISVGHEHV